MKRSPYQVSGLALIHRTLRSFSCLVGFFTLLLASAQSQTLTPRVTSFPPDVYQGHPQVFCVQPLKDGRTAFGTFQEVLIHDGNSFRSVRVGPGKFVVSMDRDRSGRLYVGGVSTMGVILPDSTGSLVHHSLIPLLPDSLKDFGRVWEVVCTRKGKVYFNTREQVFVYDGDTVRSLHPAERFFRMFIPDHQPVVQDIDSGLFRLDGTQRTFLQGSGALGKGRPIKTILPTAEKDGSWIVFTDKSGNYRYHPQKGTVHPFPDLSKEKRSKPPYAPKGGWSSAKSYTSCRLDPLRNPFGAAYAIGTKLKGLFLLAPSGKILARIGTEQGSPARFVWDIAATSGGDISAATDGGIALIHTGLPFTSIGKEDGANGSVQDITRSPSQDSSLFVATAQGTWIWEKGERSFSRIPGTAGQCLDLLPFHPGKGKVQGTAKPLKDLWILIGGNEHLLAVPTGNHPYERAADTLLKRKVRSIASLHPPKTQGKAQADGKGGPAILAGGRDGLFVLSSKALQREGTADPLLSIEKVPEDIFSVEVGAVKEDSLLLWAGLPSRGVLSVKVDRSFTGYDLEQYGKDDGLPKGAIKVFPDPKRKGVLFGTRRGLYKFRDDGFVPSCRYGKIFCNKNKQVFLVYEGVDGEVWIKDSNGGQVKHVDPEEEPPIDSTRFRALDIGSVRCFFAEKGRTWIGGDQGLVCYHPSVEEDWDRAWNCLIREVRGRNDSLLFGGNFPKVGEKGLKIKDTLLKHVAIDEQPRKMIPRLPFSENRMKFRYAAPFTDQQGSVRYRYKLEGFDTAWSKWTREKKKEYSYLPGGSYTFKVKAKNIYGVESSTAKYRFMVLPPWYRSWVAYAFYTLGGIAFIGLLLWLNSRRLLAQKQRLERIVQDRTKEIREQKEKVEEAHQEITQSIDYAQKIQYALLQSEEHTSSHLPEHFILFKPYSQVSGDFYWGQEHKGYFYIAAVDCTGHGVPGAFMSMLGISQLNEIMNTDEILTPGYILSDLRDRVVRELSGSDPNSSAKDGMDAALVKIPIPNTKSQIPSGGTEVEFAGAQNPLYVVRKAIAEDPPKASMEYQGKELEGDPIKPFRKSSDGIEIKGDGQPVGYDEYAKDAFTTVTLQLKKGDMLYFFSDGYADQFGGPKGKKFRYGPFKQLLASIHEKPLEEQKQELDKTFEDWKAESNQEQIDDVVVIGVRL